MDSCRSRNLLKMTGRAFFLLITLIQMSKSYGELNCSFAGLIESIKNDSAIPNYNVRPVLDWRNPSHVKIDLQLYTVVSLDSSIQSLITYIWFTMEWKNEFLSWDPDTFCGIKKISIPGTNLWIPDFYIYEMTEAEDKPPVIPYYVVNSDGVITSSKPIRIVSDCNLDIYKFPFDQQTCSLSFGPYVHTVKDMIMVSTSNSKEVFENSAKIFVSKGDWSLIDIHVYNTTFSSDNSEFSQVVFKIVIKRASVVYIVNLIIPACLLVILDIMSMFIQMETNERLGFKITLVLGFSVILLILNNMLPNSDTLPVLGIFCCICLTIMILSLIGSVVTAYMMMLSETQTNVPPWIKHWVLKKLARLIRFKVSLPENEDIPISDTGKDDSENRRTERNSPIWEKKEAKSSMEVKLLKRLLLEILQIHKELSLSKDTSEAKPEWHITALVLDRFVLILYVLIVIIIVLFIIIAWIA